MKRIVIYTDGACSGNQNETNVGGWGALLEYRGHKKELYGGEINTTNNRMEMTALLRALEAIHKENQHIDVFSDSAYLMRCFREKWYKTWQANGWKTSKKTPVENQDLWEALLREVEKHTISFYWVKGHVNPSSKNFDPDALYEKFVAWNGPTFSRDDMLLIMEKNNRVDELANIGISDLRSSDEEV